MVYLVVGVDLMGEQTSVRNSASLTVGEKSHMYCQEDLQNLNLRVQMMIKIAENSVHHLEVRPGPV